jgi:preprotein translocase subunit SecG
MQLVFIVVQVIITVCLIAIILVQRSSGDGVSGLSGGSNAGIMSTRGSANFLTRATAVLATLFMLNSLILANIATKHNEHKVTSTIEVESKPDVPVKPASPQVPLVK